MYSKKFCEPRNLGCVINNVIGLLGNEQFIIMLTGETCDNANNPVPILYISSPFNKKEVIK